MSKSITPVCILTLLLTRFALSVSADEPTPPVPKVIQAADAAAHAGETCVVEMQVLSSRLLKDQQMVFLNSDRDYQAEDNFTAVIFDETLEKFRALGIEDPSKHFFKRKVQVTGGIELRRGKAQIILKTPDQIQVIKPSKVPQSGVDS